MPFITPVRRTIINLYGLEGLYSDVTPGDRCYVFYKAMVDKWKAEPRWTTVHEIYFKMNTGTIHNTQDDWIAQQLAWQVFFQLYVMPYELKKRNENGDI